MLNLLFIGDIVGSPGRKILAARLQALRRELDIDFCAANGENATGGLGLARPQAMEILSSGVDAITLGNHTFARKEILQFLDSESWILRPANYAPEVPGKGARIFQTVKGPIGLINLQGRIYMDPADCPFKAADRELAWIRKQTKTIILDFHAEATSEKNALAWYTDGRVSLLAGTHTHVQTADERILPCGTAYISDAGMTGPRDSIIGMDRDIATRRLITGMPERFEVCSGAGQINAVHVKADPGTGRALLIRRIQLTEETGP